MSLTDELLSERERCRELEDRQISRKYPNRSTEKKIRMKIFLKKERV